MHTLKPSAPPRSSFGQCLKPLATLLLSAFAVGCIAQETAGSGQLYDELAAMDAKLFHVSFVSCDEGAFKQLFTDDAEFYHDKAGARFGAAVKTLHACPSAKGLTRTLVPGSLEVYPMQGYGAIQIGRHVFVQAGEPGSEEAKFVHLWKRESGGWRLARVLSFDHRPSAPKPR